jgi:multiple sugar transport system substrate-binding protein
VRRRKSTIHLGLVLVTAMVLAACGGGADEPAADDGSPSGELSFMVAEYSPATAPFWESQIASFNEEYPDVTVNLEVVGWQQMHDTTANRIAANTFPDLVNTATIWLPEWVEAGALSPVDSSILSDDLRSDFIPAVLTKGAEYEGELWGLPIAAAGRAMFLNQTLLSEAGIENAPATWSEFESAIAAVNDATGEFGYGFDAKGVQAFRYFGFFLWNNGGDFFDSDGKAAFNSPEGVEALQFLVDLASTPALPNPTGTALEDLQPLFTSGRLAMLIDGNFFVAQIRDTAPDLDYVVAPVPVNEGADPVTWGVTDTLVISKDAPADLAKLFIDHIYRPEARTEFDVNEGLLPVLSSQADDEAFADANSQAWMAMLENARFDPLHPNYSQMQELLKNELQAALIGSKSPQEALDAAAAAFDELVAG